MTNYRTWARLNLKGKETWGGVFSDGIVPIKTIAAQKVAFNIFSDPESVFSMDWKQLTEEHQRAIIEKASQKSPDPPESCPDKIDTQYLSQKTKQLTRLPPDNEVSLESCVVCGIKQQPDWIITLFDESWGFLCGPCGFKLSQKLTNN